MTTQASQIKFGIEIECYLPIANAIAAGGYHDGLQINLAPRGWNAQRDGSLLAPQGYQAVEIVSPPVAGEDGLAQIWYMVETINELGGIVNPSCGLHVHVDANSLSGFQVLAVREAFVKYERAFYGLSGRMAGWRWVNTYSKSSYRSDPRDRYQGCNITNYTNPTPKRMREGARTIEFRVWAGTLNPDEIVTAVYMAVALVADVARTENVPAVRYNTSTTARKAFVKNVWNNPDNLIIPNESIAELVDTLITQCDQAGM